MVYLACLQALCGMVWQETAKEKKKLNLQRVSEL